MWVRINRAVAHGVMALWNARWNQLHGMGSSAWLTGEGCPTKVISLLNVRAPIRDAAAMHPHHPPSSSRIIISAALKKQFVGDSETDFLVDNNGLHDEYNNERITKNVRMKLACSLAEPGRATWLSQFSENAHDNTIVKFIYWSAIEKYTKSGAK